MAGIRGLLSRVAERVLLGPGGHSDSDKDTWQSLHHISVSIAGGVCSTLDLLFLEKT